MLKVSQLKLKSAPISTTSTEPDPIRNNFGFLHLPTLKPSIQLTMIKLWHLVIEFGMQLSTNLWKIPTSRMDSRKYHLRRRTNKCRKIQSIHMFCWSIFLEWWDFRLFGWVFLGRLWICWIFCLQGRSRLKIGKNSN